MGYREYLITQGINIYEAEQIAWYKYNHALIPISLIDLNIHINKGSVKDLLNKSKALFLRWSNDPSVTESQWWMIQCKFYDKNNLSKKVRYGIRRGKEYCYVKSISSQHLAINGFSCYQNSFARYKGAKPLNRDLFEAYYCSASEGFGFEYWGVFSLNNDLIGYMQCIREEKGICTSVIKYDPNGLNLYSSYALLDSILDYYLNNQGVIVSNGSRSIYHDTNIQNYLLKFGFEKIYCHLNVEYSPLVKIIVNSLYPFRNKLSKLPPISLFPKINSVLIQEQYRRSCN